MRRDRQSGSASVLALGCGLAVLLAMLGYTVVAAAVETRHRAQTAADSAALAGAMRALDGAEEACRRARQLARANDTRLRSCELSGLEVSVEVRATGPEVLRRFGPARATARAGPVGTAAIWVRLP